jgi:hypothetical protein
MASKFGGLEETTGSKFGGVPDQDQTAQPTIMQRALANLPGSLENAALRLVRGPSMGEGGQFQVPNPNAPMQPDLGPWGNFKRNTPAIFSPWQTLKEQFAEDPLSVAQIPLTIAGRGGWAALPEEAKSAARGAAGQAAQGATTSRVLAKGPIGAARKIFAAGQQAYRKAENERMAPKAGNEPLPPPNYVEPPPPPPSRLPRRADYSAVPDFMRQQQVEQAPIIPPEALTPIYPAVPQPTYIEPSVPGPPPPPAAPQTSPFDPEYIAQQQRLYNPTESAEEMANRLAAQSAAEKAAAPTSSVDVSAERQAVIKSLGYGKTKYEDLPLPHRAAVDRLVAASSSAPVPTLAPPVAPPVKQPAAVTSQGLPPPSVRQGSAEITRFKPLNEIAPPVASAPPTTQVGGLKVPGATPEIVERSQGIGNRGLLHATNKYQHIVDELQKAPGGMTRAQFEQMPFDQQVSKINDVISTLEKKGLTKLARENFHRELNTLSSTEKASLLEKADPRFRNSTGRYGQFLTTPGELGNTRAAMAGIASKLPETAESYTSPYSPANLTPPAQ